MQVAGPVRPRARDLVAVAAARGAPSAELHTEEAPPRDERERPRRCGAHALGAGVAPRAPQSGSGRGALLDARGEDALDRLVARQVLVDDELGCEHEAVADHRHEERLDVLGRREVPAVQERPRARGALEREAAANRRADLHEVERRASRARGRRSSA